MMYYQVFGLLYNPTEVENILDTKPKVIANIFICIHCWPKMTFIGNCGNYLAQVRTEKDYTVFSIEVIEQVENKFDVSKV